MILELLFIQMQSFCDHVNELDYFFKLKLNLSENMYPVSNVLLHALIQMIDKILIFFQT